MSTADNTSILDEVGPDQFTGSSRYWEAAET